MFRMGGSTGEGITSGLQAPRQGYQDGKLSEKLRSMKASDYLTGDKTLGEIQDMASQLAYQPRGQDINDFLISTGLDLVSRPKSGNIFSQVATSSKEPFINFMAAKKEAAEQRYASESDLFKSMMEGTSRCACSKSRGIRW